MKTNATNTLNNEIKNKRKGSVELKLFYVYLIAESENGPTKIGVAGNVKSRLSDLQVGSYQKLKCYGARPFITSKEAFKFEKTLHKLFSEFKIRGEWFTLSAKQIARKTRLLHGHPDTKEQLIEKAILRGIVDMPKRPL